MTTQKQTRSTKKDTAPVGREASGFKIVNVAPVPKSDHIVKFMKWEDESAKSSFVISGVWNNRVESN